MANAYEGGADVPKATPAIERFWPKVQKTGECWTWTGTTAGSGYGWFYDGIKGVYAHRWAYEHWHGPVPSGLTIDHLCRNRSCVRPGHLEAVTLAENTDRKPPKTHCAQGHPYDEVNAVIWGNQRYCRTCNRAKKLKLHRKQVRHRERREVGPANQAKTHCPNGHPYSGANLRIDTNGARRCRACESEQNRRRKPRRR